MSSGRKLGKGVLGSWEAGEGAQGMECFVVRGPQSGMDLCNANFAGGGRHLPGSSGQPEQRLEVPPPSALPCPVPHLFDGCHAHGLIVVQGCIGCAHVVAKACDCHFITAV